MIEAAVELKSTAAFYFAKIENWPPHSRDFSRELGGQSACNGLH